MPVSGFLESLIFYKGELEKLFPGANEYGTIRWPEDVDFSDTKPKDPDESTTDYR